MQPGCSCAASLPSLRVLIIDDNAVNLMVLARLLEKDQHQVIVLNDGTAAVDYLANVEPGLVLMDIQMQAIDGLTAAQETRKRNQQLSIIAITINYAEEDQRAALAAGISGFLAKPFRHEELLRVLHKGAGHARKSTDQKPSQRA